MTRAILIAIAIAGCHQDKSTPSATSDPSSKPPPTSVVRLDATTISGAGAFEIVGSSVAVVAVALNCPSAPSGCGLKPDPLAGRPADLKSFGCPGGQLLVVAMRSQWSGLPPGRYSKKKGPAPDISLTSLRGTEQTSANDWFDKTSANFVQLDEIANDYVRGSVHAELPGIGGEVIRIEGPFKAPRCSS